MKQEQQKIKEKYDVLIAYIQSNDLSSFRRELKPASEDSGRSDQIVVSDPGLQRSLTTAALHYMDEQGGSLLIKSIELGRTLFIEALLEKKISLRNHQLTHWKNIMEIASPDLLKKLWEYDALWASELRKSPLEFVCVMDGHTRVLEGLLNVGLDVNGFTQKSSYLSIATVMHQVETALMLLSKGADASLKDNEPDAKTARTTLMHAANVGCDQLIMPLFEAGCDLDAVNQQGCTALDIALKANYDKVVHELKKAKSIKEKRALSECTSEERKSTKPLSLRV